MMHVYCYIPRPDIPVQHHRGNDILDALDTPDLFVSSNMRAKQAIAPSVRAEAETTHTPLLDHMDLLVLEGGQNDPEVGFLLAHAIISKKPTLFLYPKGTRPHIFDLMAKSALPATVVVAPYAPEKSGAVIQEFLERVSGRVMKEVPRIKFTLRITNAIDAFLQFKTANTKLSKADYLREQIERIMGQDTAWQRKRGRDAAESLEG